MRRVIIDTDPGTDDALALMMALNSPDLMVEGITTVGGNATLSETTENALRLMEYLEGPSSAIPVAVGADRPAKGLYSHAYHVHGSEGLGISLPVSTLKPHGMNAVEFLRDSISASPGQLTLIAIGPLTNVAAALDSRPDIAEAIPEIIVMGGAVGVAGNITPTPSSTSTRIPGLQTPSSSREYRSRSSVSTSRTKHPCTAGTVRGGSRATQSPLNWATASWLTGFSNLTALMSSIYTILSQWRRQSSRISSLAARQGCRW